MEYIRKTVTVTVEKTLEINIPSHLIDEMLKDVNEAIDDSVKTKDDLFKHIASHAAQNYGSCECVRELIEGFYIDGRNKNVVRFEMESCEIETSIVQEDICPNCETALPNGCGGVFKDDGQHCWLNKT